MTLDLARDFLDSVGGYLDDSGDRLDTARPLRLATIDPAYAGTGAAEVTFDGEGGLTVKTYPVMTTVAAGDRVVLLPVGRSYVILGKVGGGAWYTNLVAADAALDTRVDDLELRALRGTIPSSVAVGSGSASIAADGLVTFTSVSSVSLNGVFDGLGQDTHEAIFKATQSGAGTVVCRLRASGTDMTTATHTNVGVQSGLSTGPARSANAVSSSFAYFVPTASGAGPNVSQGRLTLFAPKINGITYYIHKSISLANGDRYMWDEAGNTPTGSHDGISFITSAGTMSGTVRVVKLA